jgi:hypothetical protein
MATILFKAAVSTLVILSHGNLSGVDFDTYF